MNTDKGVVVIEDGVVVIPQQDYVHVKVDEDGRIVIEQTSIDRCTQVIKLLPIWATELCDGIMQAVKFARERRR